MTHPLADRLRRQGRLGAPVVNFLPGLITVPTTGGDVDKILQQIDQAQDESENLSIPGIDPGAMRAKVLQAFLDGGTDPKAFLQEFFGTGAALACTAVGSPALAPLCMAGGQVIGEAVAGFQVKPVGPGPSAAGEALAAMLKTDNDYLQAQREGMFFQFAARFNSAPQATAQIERILQEFFGGVGCFAPMDDGQCVYYKGTQPCVSGTTPGWTNAKGVCSVTALPAYGGGFYLPFYVLNGCPLIGKNYHDLCGQFWEWELDFSGVSNAQQKVQLKPDWWKSLLTVIQGILQQNNIDVDVAFDAIRKKTWPTTSTAEALSAIYLAVRGAIWPAMQLALEKRLKVVVVEVAVKANEKLVLGVDKLATVIAQRQGCQGGECLKVAQQTAIKLADKTREVGVAEMAKQVNATYHDPKMLEIIAGSVPKPTEQPSKARPVVALGVTVGLLYLLHRAIKRYV